MSRGAREVGLVFLLVLGGRLCLGSAAQPQTKPTPPGFAKKFRFADESEIKKDWKLSGTWRIEGQGLRLYADKTTELESTFKVMGDMDLALDYEISPRRELVVSLWGEHFELKTPDTKLKTLVPLKARITRKGDAITFRTGNDKGTTVKLQEKRRDQASALVIHLDRKSTSRTYRELFIRSIEVKAATVERGE